MMACPFGVPRYEWDRVWAPRVKKCHMCAPRQAEGLKPACTEVCPVQAGVFGELEELLREAMDMGRILLPVGLLLGL